MARNTVLVFENFGKRTKRPKIQSLLNGKFGNFPNGIKFAVLKTALLRLHLAALAVVGVDAEEALRRVEARLIARLGGTGPESVFSDFHAGKRCGWWW